MESVMGDTEDLYFLRFEHRPLTPEQWDRLTRNAVRRAREERTQMLRSLFVATLTSVQRAAKGGRDLAGALGSRAAAAVRRGWRSYATWRERQRAIKELGLLDDRALKDIGLHRSEIESVVYGPDSSRVTEGKVAAVLFHKPHTRRSSNVTPEQKKLVKETWDMVVPIADTAVDMFYNRLFEIDPTTRKLFRASTMPEQRRKLVKALAFAVNSLDDPAPLVAVLEDLGRRHSGYGVTDAHYDSVGAALLWTLQQGLGQAWTPAVAAAWIEVYGLVSGTMRRAAHKPSVTATTDRAAAA
jgi:hemoglobin-like flavoprotein/uncharacterized protein YjiS (DUF1127 family)